jgi:hypothetical protein
MTVDKTTVEQALNIIKKEFQKQAALCSGSCFKHLDTFKKTKNPKHLFDAIRLHYQAEMLAGLTARIGPDWFNEVQK